MNRGFADGGIGEWPAVCFTEPSTNFPFLPIPYPCCDPGLSQDPPLVGRCSPCAAGQPSWNCIWDGRGGHNESAYRPLSSEFLLNGASLCDRGLFYNPITGKCENASRFRPDVSAFVGTDLWKRLRHQHRLAQHLPLSEGLWLGTHNSFNNASDGYIQYNQFYSMSDQLRMGIRYLDIDINCDPNIDPFGEIRMAHASSIETIPGTDFEFVLGMSPFDRPLRNGLEEIRAWLDANPGEFLIISHEERTKKANPNALYEMYSRIFGGMIVTPAEFENYYGAPRSEMINLFRAADWIDGSANGQIKRVLVIMRDKDGGGTDAGGLAFRNVSDSPGYDSGGSNGAPAFVESLSDGPVVSSSLITPDQHDLFEGSFQNSSMTPIEPDVAAQMVAAGVNAILFEPLGTANIVGGLHNLTNIFGVEIPFEDLMEAAAWSWDAGHPQVGGAKAALLVRSAGRFRSANPGEQHPFAMQSVGGKAWGLTSATGQFWNAESIVAGENGKLPTWRFAVPGNGLQMQRLLHEMEQRGIDACWVAYEDLNGNGVWDPTVYRDFDQEAGTTLWVSKQGSDTNSGDSEESPLLTIGEAIRVAPLGTTIRVGPGVYHETVQVFSDNDPDSPFPTAAAVSIIGDPDEATIIEGAYWNYPAVWVYGEKSTANLSNLWLRNAYAYGGSPETDPLASGVVAQNGATVSVRRCTITDNERAGVWAYPGCEVLIEQCTITRNDRGGVSFFLSDKPLKLYGSTITDNGPSTSQNGPGGLHIQSVFGGDISAQCEIHGNIIANNANGNIAEFPYPANSNLRAFRNVIDPLPAATQVNGYAWIGEQTNILNQDPNLGPFGMSGGNLPVRVPRAGSPALDYFNTAPSYLLGAVDGRNLSRFVKGTCDGVKYNGIAPADAGAAERQGGPQSVFYVSASGNDSWTGESPSGGGPGGPLASLHEAVSRACPDQVSTIFISGPTQTQPVTITDKQIRVVAKNNWEFDRVIGSSNGAVITIDGPEDLLFEISGVRLSGGFAPSGAGLRVLGATAIVDRCVVEDNASSGSTIGGGISAENGAVLVLKNSIITRNRSDGRGGGLGISDSRVDVFNTVFYENHASSGGGIGVVGDDSEVYVTHCTIADNSATLQPGAGISQAAGSLVVRNSMVTRNGSHAAAYDMDPLTGDGTIVVASLVQGPSVLPGEGNTNAEPKFVSAPRHDYRLLVTSPGVDAAKPLESGAISADIYGSPRGIDNLCVPNAFGGLTAPDMGAFEAPAFADENRNGVNDGCELLGTIDSKRWTVSASNLGPFQVYATPGSFIPLVAVLEGASPDDQVFMTLDGYTAIEFNLERCDPNARHEVPIPAALFELAAEDGVVDIQLFMTQPNGNCLDSEFVFSIEFEGAGFEDCNENTTPDSVEGQPFATNISDPSATAVTGAPDGVGVLMTPGRSLTVDLGMGRMYKKPGELDFIVYGVEGTPISPSGLKLEVSENGYDFFVVASFGFGNFALPGAEDHTDQEARINAAIDNTPLERVRYIRLTGTPNGSFGKPVNLDAVGVIRYERVDPFGAEAVSLGSGSTRAYYEGLPDYYAGFTANGVVVRHPNADLSDGPGADLTIYAAKGTAAAGVPVAFDSVTVEVSTDGSTWVSIDHAGTTLKRVPGDQDFLVGVGISIAKSFDLGLAGVERAEFVRVTGLNGYNSMRVDSMAFINTVNRPCQTACPGDANGDGVVDLADLNLVLGNFGAKSDQGDLDGNGAVDLADLNILLSRFGSSCP